MKVILIEPPFERLKKINYGYFPLGLGYISTVLNTHGIYCRVYNAEFGPEKFRDVSKNFYEQLLERYPLYIDALEDDDHYVWKEIRETLKKYKPDAVGISVKTAKLPSALKIAGILKKLDEKCFVIFGGYHPTTSAKNTLKNNDVDFVVRGEGEHTFLELCQELASSKPSFNRIKGLSYKKKKKIISNPPRTLIKDLDKLPILDKSYAINPDLYSKSIMGDIITSRGCPFDCTFCSQKEMWEGCVRYRKIDQVILEMEKIINQFHTKQFYFWDDTFTMNRKRIINLCEEIIKRNFNILWGCTTRVDFLDTDLLRMMKKAGCVSIDIGIESGSQKILDSLQKGITIDQVKKAVEMIKKAKIECNAFFMIGFPQETEQDIKKTIALIKQLDVSNISLSIFTPYPGSELYLQSKEMGLIEDNTNYALYSHQSPYNFFNKNISRKKYKKYLKEMAIVVDRKNNRLSRKINFLRVRSSFYLQNPNQFLDFLR
ncbi:radical SAM protein [Candidatus Woesearchaeota archaeon]|nr:radical SAM protein [Candidatus Woesearchaeota archaeon]